MFCLLIQGMFGCKTECADSYCTKTVAVPVTVLSMATDEGEGGWRGGEGLYSKLNLTDSRVSTQRGSM